MDKLKLGSRGLGQALRDGGDGGSVGGGDHLPFEPDVEIPFNAADIVPFRPGDEGGSGALQASAAGTTDAMDEIFRNLRYVEVNDVGDGFDVKTAGGDVGADEDAELAVLEAFERTVTLALRAVTVDAGGADAVLFEAVGKSVSTVLGANEDHERTVVDAQHVLESPDLVILV